MAELTGDEPDLRLGDFGAGVMLLQVRLYALGIYRQVPDGVFDMFTENAVRELQSTLLTDNDGVVAAQTWEGIRYLETQNNIQYQYSSPYDALDQIQYDLQQADVARDDDLIGQLSGDGQWWWDGTTWLAVGDPYAGSLSEDGYWRWTGAEWQPVS